MSVGLSTDRINNKLEKSNLINEHALDREPVPLKARKLDRVNVRKDFWDVTRNRENNWPIADLRVPCNDPRNNFGTRFGPSSFLVFPHSLIAHV